MKTEPGLIHYSNKQDYLAKKPAKVPAQNAAQASSVPKPKEEMPPDKVDISETAKTIASLPVPTIPLGKMPTALEIKAKKAADKPQEAMLIRKPGIFFISGWKMFGLSSDDTSMKAMSENIPGAKHFEWGQEKEIIEEIRKRPADQPVILVGHSLGGETAVNVANKLNNMKEGFRKIDLLVTLDSFGANHEIVPQNVAKNLNFIEDKSSFFGGSPNIARNTELTDVINELRTEGHTEMDDSPEVQFKIFDSINDVLGDAALKKNFKKLATIELLEAHVL